MIYTTEVQHMFPVAKGAYHGPAPIPEEGKWVQAKEISDISGLTHGVGWCAPQQGACKLTLNVKNGIIEEALVETLGCTGMTHSAAMAGEILIGKTIEEAEAEFEGRGYGIFKPAVGEAVVELLRPIREESERMIADKAYLESVYKEGAQRAQYLANKTLSKVYRKIGFVAR